MSESDALPIIADFGLSKDLSAASYRDFVSKVSRRVAKSQAAVFADMFSKSSVRHKHAALPVEIESKIAEFAETKQLSDLFLGLDSIESGTSTNSDSNQLWSLDKSISDHFKSLQAAQLREVTQASGRRYDNERNQKEDIGENATLRKWVDDMKTVMLAKCLRKAEQEGQYPQLIRNGMFNFLSEFLRFRLSPWIFSETDLQIRLRTRGRRAVLLGLIGVAGMICYLLSTVTLLNLAQLQVEAIKIFQDLAFIFYLRLASILEYLNPDFLIEERNAIRLSLSYYLPGVDLLGFLGCIIGVTTLLFSLSALLFGALFLILDCVLLLHDCIRDLQIRFGCWKRVGDSDKFPRLTDPAIDKNVAIEHLIRELRMSGFTITFEEEEPDMAGWLLQHERRNADTLDVSWRMNLEQDDDDDE